MIETVLKIIEIMCLLAITSLIMTFLKNIKKQREMELKERNSQRIFVTFLKAGGGKLCISVDQLKRIEACDEKRTYLYIGHDPKTGRASDVAVVQEAFGDVIFRLYPYINLCQRGAVAQERNNQTIEAEGKVMAVDIEEKDQTRVEDNEQKDKKAESIGK